jgi:hypothetical protein
MASIDADLTDGYVRLLSNASTFSTMLSQYETALGSNSGDNFLYNGSAFTSAAGFVDVESDAGGLNINENINLASSSFSQSNIILNVAGIIDETNNAVIDAYSLTGSAYGTVTLNDNNVISVLNGFNTGRNAPFSLVDSSDLDVKGEIDTGTQSITLKAVHSGHNIIMDSLFSGGTVGLYAGGTITEGTLGKIDATKLTGSAEGAVKIGYYNNKIASLGDFAVTAAGGFALTDNETLDVTGAISADDSSTIALSTKSGNLSVHGTLDASTVTLVTAGEATQSSTSGITAGTLNVTAQTGIDLVGNNDIKKVGTRKTKSGPNTINM